MGSSVGMMTFPIDGKVIKAMFQTTNQIGFTTWTNHFPFFLKRHDETVTTRQLLGINQLIRDQFPLLFSGLVSLLKSIEYNDEQSKILTKNRYIIYHSITCIYIYVYIYMYIYIVNNIYICVCMLFFWFTESLPYSGKFWSVSQPTAAPLPPVTLCRASWEDSHWPTWTWRIWWAKKHVKGHFYQPH